MTAEIALERPINLHATQIGTTGTQIQLTWGYDNDSVDGFKIEYARPSGSSDHLFSGPNDCTNTNNGLSCVSIISGLPPYASYKWRVLAFKDTIESEYSSSATGFQLLVEGLSCTSTGCSPPVSLFVAPRTDLNSIQGTFRPDPGTTLNQAAQFFGYDHFNWISVINHDETTTEWCSSNQCPLSPPYLDPPPGGYTKPTGQRPFDSLPYYWNEQSGYDADYFISRYEDANSTQFFDHPYDPGRPSGGYISFFTTLVGVMSPIALSPARYVPLASFKWISTNNAADFMGLGRHSNLDPADTPETGGSS